MIRTVPQIRIRHLYFFKPVVPDHMDVAHYRTTRQLDKQL